MLIGFVGKIGSGKDTASDYLINKYGFISLRLSDVVAEELTKLGMNTSRENKQMMGTKMRREFGKDILMRKLFEGVRKGRDYIFNGIRHPEEANFLKKNKGLLIKIECDSKIRFERTKNRDKIDFKEFEIIDNRESEKTIDKIKVDFSVKNNGTLENFYNQLDKIIQEIS